MSTVRYSVFPAYSQVYLRNYNYRSCPNLLTHELYIVDSTLSSTNAYSYGRRLPGLRSRASPCGTGQASDPILPLSCSQSPVFLVNSRSPRLSETSNSSRSKSSHHQRHTFSRSYGVKLQSSLTPVLSSALEFSSHPPVSVCGTDDYYLKLRGFSWKRGVNNFELRRVLVLSSWD